MFRKFVLALLILPMLSLAAQNSFIEYIEGGVELERNGSSFEPVFGDDLESGDIVITGATGLVIINLADRGQIKILPETTFVLESLDQNIEVSLKSGGVFSRLSNLRGSEFNLRAGSTLAGVRGTEFFTLYGEEFDEESDIWLCVNEGTVEVSLPEKADKQTTFVKEGEGINILAGATITAPRFYEWTTELNWNMDPSSGAVGDETSASSLYDDLLDVDYD